MGQLIQRVLFVVRWSIIGCVIGVFCGIAGFVFLYGLSYVTTTREANKFLLWCMAPMGLSMGIFYVRFGDRIKAGNNLVIDTVAEADRETIPLRMAPMVVLATWATHLVGGSAGREGTAVQMGASIADQLSHLLRWRGFARKQVLAAGIAGGFGAVFGTPIAGAIFATELVVIGLLEVPLLFPALVSSIVADRVAMFCGAKHSHFPKVNSDSFTWISISKWIFVAILIAIVSATFMFLLAKFRTLMERMSASLPIRMVIGGAAMTAFSLIPGTEMYLGLGTTTIEQAFSSTQIASYAFAIKLAVTVITIGSGFIGGEVTPLFFIGATLGNTCARMLHLPMELTVAVCMTSLFAVSSNTPIALSLMALELFGIGVFPQVILVSLIAYLLCGERSIYGAQRVRWAKGSEQMENNLAALQKISGAKEQTKNKAPKPVA